MIEQKFLPAPSEEAAAAGREITTETLRQYLLQLPGYNKRNANQFSKELDLYFFAPAIEAVASAKKEVYVLPPDYRLEVMSKTKEISLPELDIYLNEKAPAEHFCLAYYDERQRAFTFSEVIGGDSHSVRFNLKALIGENCYGMLAIHTHPNDAFISPQDYSLMLRATSEGERFAPGVLVLCPGVQILALPTAGTPLLEVGSIGKWRADWDMRLNQEAFVQRYSVFGVRLIDKAKAKFKLVEEQVDRGVISEDEGGKRTAEIQNKVAEKLAQYEDNAKQQKRRNSLAFKNKHKKVVNSVIVECARSLGVVLYGSTDSRYFEKYSA
jgi:hypothetical protein